MTIEKMKAGRRTPRNPVILDVLRDYGYVDARGMGVRVKVIPLTRRFTGTDPLFEATDDYLKTVIGVGNASVDVPENQKMSLKIMIRLNQKDWMIRICVGLKKHFIELL